MAMNEYDYCCSKDGHGLKYKEFSVVLLQFFTLDRLREFVMPQTPQMSKNQEFIISPIEDNSIDKLIFNLNKDDRSIRRFLLPSFKFALLLQNTEVEPNKYPYSVTMEGTVRVEMSLLFENTVSISYRFVFDNSKEYCKVSEPVATDHVIALLASHLSAEHWSKNSDGQQTDINLELLGFKVEGLRLSDTGKPLYDNALESLILNGEGRIFNAISDRYKKFILNYCTDYKPSTTKVEKLYYEKKMANADNIEKSYHDYHYAMVDIWEDLQHPLADGSDLFAKDRQSRFSEADIINHIRDFHKPELIGLMTLYPGEWPYRDASAYDEVCGENIAIDTDDLVLVNNNMCVVFGTYGRRGGDEAPVDWANHLKERSNYHVSWPEYLLILEMVLAKKYIIEYAKDQLIAATLKLSKTGGNGNVKVSAEDIIADNAELNMRIAKLELQLDVVKYSKFMSHKVMFDRTTARLELEKDVNQLNSLMGIVDSSLHSISDYRSMRSDYTLNFVLGIISVASLFQIFYEQSELPFLTYFGYENRYLAALISAFTAVVAIAAFSIIFVKQFKKIVAKVKKFINYNGQY